MSPEKSLTRFRMPFKALRNSAVGQLVVIAVSRTLHRAELQTGNLYTVRTTTTMSFTLRSTLLLGEIAKVFFYFCMQPCVVSLAMC